MHFSPNSTKRKALPYVVVGGGVVAAAAIVGGFLAIPAVSGSTGAVASTTEEVAVVTERPALGAARDPLSQDELSYALHLATTDPALPENITSVDGSEAPQVLSVDVTTRDVDASDRFVDVVLYDYTSNRTFMQAVNLTAATVSGSSREGVQPPPSADEVDYAFRVFLADATASAGVRAEYTSVAGGELSSIDQLGVSGGAFSPDASTVGGDVCQVDRCVEMQFRVPGGGYLDTSSFVVDLSNRTVIGIQ
ncbi:hypothetical protein [Herbiconiux ginsengi]|uniref:hypothetical protein n=1 Tax=Herbiconiux ginsengi TaxID=381665 RepID=UPI000AEE1EA1|nr:hypothetical protein [Herbiconiux ginsengi]